MNPAPHHPTALFNTTPKSQRKQGRYSPWLDALRRLLLTMAALFCAASVQALQLTWHPLGNNGGPGSGNWDITTTDTNWWNGATDIAWTQVSTTTGSNTAIFSGPDGTNGEYNITNDSVQICPSNFFINASGYSFYGDPIDVWSDGTLSAMVVAPGKTVNFYCQMGNANNGKYYVLGASSVVNFFGNVGTSQPKFLGPTNSAFYLGGSSDTAGVPNFLAPCYLTNGAYTAGASFFIAYDSGNSYNGTNYTNGSLTVTGTGILTQNSGGSFLMGRSGGQGTLTVSNGGTINVGIANKTANVTVCTDGNGNESGTLNVGPGGTFNAGAGSGGSASLISPIIMCGGGSQPGEVALLNQTGGAIYAWGGIEVGESGGTFAGGSALITNSGGSLYLGPNGILVEAHFPPTNYASFSSGVVAALANWSSSIAISLPTLNSNITFQCADNNNSPYNISLSGPLTGTGGFNVTGGGTLNLTGSNNYAGSTMVSNGVLEVATSPSPVSGTVTLDGSSGSPTLQANVTPGSSWTIGGPLTFQNGATTLSFQFGPNEPSASVAPLQVSGNVSFATTPSVTICGSEIPFGTYKLISYTGSVSGTLPTVTTWCGGSASAGSIVNNPGTQTIELVVTASSVKAPLFWAVGNGSWDFATPNWLQNNSAADYTDGDTVFFPDSATGTSPIMVSLSTIVQPGGVTANNNAKSYTISGTGSIAGTNGVTVEGGGTFALGCANSYTGGTVLSSGQLNINNGGDSSGLDSAIGTGPFTIDAGTAIDNTSGSNVVLQPTNNETWNGSFTYIGSSNSLNTGPGAVTLAQDNIIVTVDANNFIVGGAISDNGSNYTLTKAGSGTLTLPVANSFGSSLGIGLNLVNGQINLGNSTAVGNGIFSIGTSSSTVAIDNVSGGPLTLNPGTQTLGYYWEGTITYVGSSTNILDLGSAAVSVLGGTTLNVLSNTLECDQDIGSGNVQMFKAGAGTLIIGGNSDTRNTLGMTVTGGTLEMARAIGLTIANSGSASGKGLTVESNALVLDLGNGNPQIGHGANVPVTLESGGILDLYGNSETIDSLLLNGGILQNEDTNSSTSTLSVVYPGNVATLEGPTNQINVGQTASLTIDATITGSGSFTMNGPGTLILSSNNTYTGQTTVQGGTIALPGGGAISGSSNIFLATTNSALDLSQNTNYSANNNPVLTIQNAQILSGFGVVTSLVVSVSGATVAPGSPSAVGTLTVTGFNSDSNVLGGVTMMKLNKGAHTNDQLVVQQGSLALGGTLALTNLSGTLAVGDSFTLFAAGGGITGSFASITPAFPGPGLGWNTANLAVNGSLSIVAVAVPPRPVITSVSLSGTTLTIQGTNGVASGQYYLVESTNLALPVSSWVPVQTNSFDGSGDFSASFSTTNVPALYFTIFEPQ